VIGAERGGGGVNRVCGSVMQTGSSTEPRAAQSDARDFFKNGEIKRKLFFRNFFLASKKILHFFLALSAPLKKTRFQHGCFNAYLLCLALTQDRKTLNFSVSKKINHSEYSTIFRRTLQADLLKFTFVFFSKIVKSFSS
jgi:hypothetical protein